MNPPLKIVCLLKHIYASVIKKDGNATSEEKALTLNRDQRLKIKLDSLQIKCCSFSRMLLVCISLFFFLLQ